MQGKGVNISRMAFKVTVTEGTFENPKYNRLLFSNLDFPLSGFIRGSYEDKSLGQIIRLDWFNNAPEESYSLEDLGLSELSTE